MTQKFHFRLYMQRPPQKQKTDLKEYMFPYVHCCVIYSSQAMESTQVPIHRGVEKENITQPWKIKSYHLW